LLLVQVAHGSQTKSLQINNFVKEKRNTTELPSTLLTLTSEAVQLVL
jgi:hypothetical protein